VSNILSGLFEPSLRLEVRTLIVDLALVCNVFGYFSSFLGGGGACAQHLSPSAFLSLQSMRKFHQVRMLVHWKSDSL